MDFEMFSAAVPMTNDNRLLYDDVRPAGMTWLHRRNYEPMIDLHPHVRGPGGLPISRWGCGFSNLPIKQQPFIFPPEFLDRIYSYLPIVVIDICNDGCLLKKILKYGTVVEGGNPNPKDPDVVLVKYEARLDDGTFVKTSNEVEFTVKDGHFCPALSNVVKTMKTGERADLTVKPRYGFGETGKLGHGDEGSVPPNATLQITLELVSWKKIVSEVIDFTKEVVKEGEGYEFPNEGSIVKLKLIGMLHDGTIFLKKGHDDDEAELFEFKTDEEQVIDGLDRGVMTMKKGEVAMLTIPPQYAFGSSESSQQELAMVPPNSTLYYEVELVSFKKDKESSEMNNEEKIEAARKKQEEGNALYNAKKYARASKRYEQAVKFIEYYISFSDEEKESAWDLKFSCILSNAACQWLLRNHKKYWKLIDEAETPELRRKNFMSNMKLLSNMNPKMDVAEVTDIEMYIYKKKCEIQSWIHETINWGRKVLNM